MAKKELSIKAFRPRDFSEYCEYVVAFKLQGLGWKVYQPLSDRYIDIVAYRKIKGKPVIRTIQVKGSRVESKGEKKSYGLTHKPKDLMHDPSHFFIWLFYNNKGEENFVILSVNDFIKIMGSGLKTMSWRKGNDRTHYSTNLEKSTLKPYINNWKSLEKSGDVNTFKKCINSQEISDKWKSKEAVKERGETNSKILKTIPAHMRERIKRKTELGD